VQILGSKFWALGGLNQKSKFCRVPRGELTVQIWLDSIEKQNRRSNLKERVTDRRTDGHKQSQRQKIKIGLGVKQHEHISVCMAN